MPPDPERRRVVSRTGQAAAAPGMDGAQADLASAIGHHRAGRHGEAAAMYRQLLDAQPDNFDALHLLGVVTAQTGRKQVAVDLIGRAVVLDPNRAEAHANLGILLRELGRLDEAVAACRAAIALKPDYAEAHDNLGVAFYHQGTLDEAVACYRKAIAVKPDYAEAHNNLGVALRHQGKLDEAMASFREAIALEPGHAGAHNNLGNMLRDQGEPEEAAAAHQRALALKPDYAEAHINLGLALKDQGKLAEAVVSYRKAIALKPDYADAHRNLGNALRQQGGLDEAIACFRRAIAIDPDNVGAHFGYAMAHTFVPGDAEIEKLKELLGREDISQGMSKDQWVRIPFALGKAHDDIGSYAEAFSYFTTANEEMAKQVNFDAARHRNDITKIKSAFPRGGVVSGEVPGDAQPVAVFVVGMSRSGKTLVESLLSQHDDAHGVGENREWFHAMETVVYKYAISTPYPACMELLTDDHVREMGQTYIGKLHERFPRSRLLVNTVPGYFKYIGLILRALPTARIIYCHRESMDNCLFVYFKRYVRGNNYSYELANVASFYADYRGMMAHWQGLYEDRILGVRYEDLVRDPVDIGARIYEFCGLEHDPKSVRHAFTTAEIGHWKNYEPYLGTLRQALGGLPRQSNGDRDNRN